MPIPDDLAFAALVAPIVNEGDNRINFNEVLAEQIDELIAEDEISKGGGSYKEWRPRAYERITHLTDKAGKSLEGAIGMTLDELSREGIEDDPVNLERSYQRYVAKSLAGQIGQAIADNNQEKAVELLRELLLRHITFGLRWPA